MSSNMIESVVSLPVINPETGGVSRSFRYMGKVDRVDGRRLIDWKSTSDPDRFIREKRIGLQPYLYALALQAAGIEIDEIEYRLVTVPTIRLCGKDEKAAVEQPEPPEYFYEKRCIEWLESNPMNLREHVLILNPGRIDKARQLLWDCGKRVLDCRQRATWLPNEFACFTWNQPCEYIGLCELIADGVDHAPTINAEFESCDRHPEIKQNDRSVLTASSIALLRLCEAKYFWHYELGIRPRLDYFEARWIGSAMHVGLEAVGKGQNGNAAIEKWSKENPAIGEGVRYVEQQIAKARAMVHVAEEKWEAITTKGT